MCGAKKLVMFLWCFARLAVPFVNENTEFLFSSHHSPFALECLVLQYYFAKDALNWRTAPFMLAQKALKGTSTFSTFVFISNTPGDEEANSSLLQNEWNICVQTRNRHSSSTSVWEPEDDPTDLYVAIWKKSIPASWVAYARYPHQCVVWISRKKSEWDITHLQNENSWDSLECN